MKSKNEVIKDLEKIIDIKTNILINDDIILKKIFHFYKKYPEYQDLEANGVYFIIKFLEAKKEVSVHKFMNGSIFFISELMGKKNQPICNISDWYIKRNWEYDLDKYSEKIGEINL